MSGVITSAYGRGDGSPVASPSPPSIAAAPPIGDAGADIGADAGAGGRAGGGAAAAAGPADRHAPTAARVASASGSAARRIGRRGSIWRGEERATHRTARTAARHTSV